LVSHQYLQVLSGSPFSSLKSSSASLYGEALFGVKMEARDLSNSLCVLIGLATLRWMESHSIRWLDRYPGIGCGRDDEGRTFRFGPDCMMSSVRMPGSSGTGCANASEACPRGRSNPSCRGLRRDQRLRSNSRHRAAVAVWPDAWASSKPTWSCWRAAACSPFARWASPK
jgi:hypothetical protein